MSKEIIKQVYGSFPEAFYDFLAYIVPSAFLSIFILLGFGLPKLNLVLNFISKSSWIVDMFVAILTLGLLYFIGQIITTISFVIISMPALYLLSIISKFIMKSEFRPRSVSNFNKDYLRIRLSCQPIVPELTKRYGRWMSGRNMALSSAILSFLSRLSWESQYLYIYLSIFVVTFCDCIIRRYWLETYMTSINERMSEVEITHNQAN